MEYWPYDLSQERPMPDETTAAEVQARLDAGWRPSASTDRRWIRGGTTRPESDDRARVEIWDADEPMTDAEEQVLIEHRYSIDDTVGGALDPLVTEEPDDVA